jgi:hypothetical protein
MLCLEHPPGIWSLFTQVMPAHGSDYSLSLHTSQVPFCTVFPFPYDRTIMSPFVNRWPFYPQISLEKLPRIAPPLNKFPHSKTAPPRPETTTHVLTSLTSPFYKSHTWPRFTAAPSFPQPAWQFGPAIKLCSMDMRLFSWAFFVSGIVFS